jgi:ABC-type transport system substrate-binding protein
MQDDLIARYQQGELTLVETFDLLALGRLRNIPRGEAIISPVTSFLEIGFNQRDEAPNARANRGVSIFKDIQVRRAFVEAFDRCTAIGAQLGIQNCADPNRRTDELTTPPSPDYDPTFALPRYNPLDAAALLTRAGYPVVNGVRRYNDGKTPIVLNIIPSHAGVPYADIAHQMQQDYQQNLQIRVTYAPEPALQAGAATSGHFDISLIGDGRPPDPVGTFLYANSASIPSEQNQNGENFLGVIDPGAVVRDKMGAQVSDGAQRAEVYRLLQRDFASQL